MRSKEKDATVFRTFGTTVVARFRRAGKGIAFLVTTDAAEFTFPITLYCGENMKDDWKYKRGPGTQVSGNLASAGRQPRGVLTARPFFPLSLGLSVESAS